MSEEGSAGVAVTMLLCDFAEELNGKLYVMGGGWSRLTMRSPAANISLAVRIEVPWDLANISHKLKAHLVTADGQQVMFENQPVQVEGEFEVGRPPGTTRGTPLVSTFALRFDGLPFEAGRYEWRLDVDGEPEAATAFEVIKEES